MCLSVTILLCFLFSYLLWFSWRISFLSFFSYSPLSIFFTLLCLPLLFLVSSFVSLSRLLLSTLKHLSNYLSKHTHTHPDQLDGSWIFPSLLIGREQWATGVRVLSVHVLLISDFPGERVCVCVYVCVCLIKAVVEFCTFSTLTAGQFWLWFTRLELDSCVSEQHSVTSTHTVGDAGCQIKNTSEINLLI